ncbi:transglutaminase-like cysteine peptidase [Oleiphilus sp. HI0132]|uniref:transglutaminase-like cysteine peptidase n=2 Tax=Oleiphilus sp. HI0132 TaxID=1822270 RepID=UPI0009EDF545|nr:transglutaminase-like cysteine peptidase [Oleiphilus sp. HI0132]
MTPIFNSYCLGLTLLRTPIYKRVVIIFFITTCASALDLNSKVLDFIDQRFGQDAVSRLQQWERIANYKQNITHQQKLKLVNQFFNRVKFVSDQEQWNKEDYWATPLEFLATNAGDCEDFSIAKYFTLREMGIPDDMIKITYVKALELNQAHMVLAYYPTPDAEPLILDNLINEIKPAGQRTDLAPVYSFNGEGLWLSKIRGQEGKRIGNADKLESWVELFNRHYKLLK